MEVTNDFKKLLELFNSHKVDYIIIGAYALAYYGVPRYTGDIDILVNPDVENAERVMSALDEFGITATDVSALEFSKFNNVVQIGVSPVRVDILTSISGLSWEEAAFEREHGMYGGVAVHCIAKAQFIANKRAIGRSKDLADLEALGEL